MWGNERDLNTEIINNTDIHIGQILTSATVPSLPARTELVITPSEVSTALVLSASTSAPTVVHA